MSVEQKREPSLLLRHECSSPASALSNKKDLLTLTKGYVCVEVEDPPVLPI